jgi:hypothetical protein
MRGVLRIIAKIDDPKKRSFHMAERITDKLVSDKIKYSVEIYDNTVYFEELNKTGRTINIVELDIDTGKYEIVNLEKYLRR